MKKWILTITVMAVILCLSMTVFATESSSAVVGGSAGGGGGGGSSAVVPAATDYTVTDLYLSDLAGTRLDTEDGIPTTGKFFINASVVKNTSTAPQGYLMLATYTEGGQFLDYNVMAGNYPYGETVTFMATATNTDGKIGQIKAFVWNSLSGMTPLSNTKVYGVEDDTPNGGDTPEEDTNKISFTLDLYEGWNADLNDISYLENANSVYASRARIDAEPEIIFNGVQKSEWTMDTFFGSGYTQILPHPNDIYSGRITLINNDTDAAYDMVEIEIGTPAVVNRVGEDGVVTFKNSVVLPRVINNTLVNNRNLPYLNFASTAENYSIHLTKDGNSIAYTELNERDVLCIINADDANMFDIQVLGDNNIVDGYVSATRNYSTNIKLSDNNWRGVDVRGYDVNGLKAGNTGRFYIDSYGKIVAFYDDVFIDGIDNAPHYAVILNAAADIDTWGKNEICLQVLDQSGEVLELTFAEEVLYYNLDSVDGAPYINGYYNTPEMMVETALIQNAGTFASAIIGEMMTYETDDAGKVTSITFPQDVDSEEKLYMPTKTAITAGYDEESMKLGFATLDKDTLVFYITNAAGTGTLTGYSVSGADPNYCRVAKAFELVAGDYKYVSFNNGEGAAKAVIIYNTSGYVFSTTPNIAVIESVGKTEISDDAYIVNYWVGGEFKTAQTVVGLPDITPSNAVKGDVWNLSVNNGVITSAEKIFDCIGTN